MRRLSLAIIFFVIFQIPPRAQEIAAGRGTEVSGFTRNADKFISARSDGYIEIWNTNQSAPSKPFQLTTYKIEKIISHPEKEEICIVEADEISGYRISAWNYALKRKLFSLHSAERVTFINYSGSGGFIITSGFGGSPLALINARTGEITQTQIAGTDNIIFAATGRAERNMLLYESGADAADAKIIYVDMESGAVINAFPTERVSNPVMFGNNSFLAGISSSGLLIIDAASGNVFDSVNTPTSALLCSTNDEVYCLSPQDAATALRRISVNSAGKTAEQKSRFPLFNAGQRGAVQTRITEAAIGESSVAFLTEHGDFGFLPLDYRLLNSGLTLLKKEGYSRITAFSARGEDQFILWRPGNARIIPLLIGAGKPSDEGRLNSLSGGFPLRTISVFNDKILVLDTSGNTSLRYINDILSKPFFSFSSVGINDALLINDEIFLLCRGVINNNSPFLFVNIKTGETVPVFFDTRSAVMAYSGKSGRLLAEAVQGNGSKLNTVVLTLNSGENHRPSKIFEYAAEANHLSIAESGGNLAIACDSEGAFILADKVLSFGRTSGLPVKILGHDDFFLSLDNDGNIAWHDNKTGDALAVFSLYSDKWILLTDKEKSGSLLRR